MVNFISIDVETANADMASICSIGAAKFENGRLTSEWYSLVNPQDYFDEINVSIHGINEGMVVGAPTYAEAANILHEMLSGTVAVTHTHFDRIAIHQASQRWSIPKPDCIWLDSARVARRACRPPRMERMCDQRLRTRKCMHPDRLQFSASSCTRRCESGGADSSRGHRKHGP